MVGRRLFAFAAVALLAACSAVSYAISAVERGIYRAFGFVFGLLEAPLAIVPTFARLAVDGPAPSYDAPPAHFTRHEAGTSRRSAARNT